MPTENEVTKNETTEDGKDVTNTNGASEASADVEKNETSDTESSAVVEGSDKLDALIAERTKAVEAQLAEAKEATAKAQAEADKAKAELEKSQEAPATNDEQSSTEGVGDNDARIKRLEEAWAAEQKTRHEAQNEAFVNEVKSSIANTITEVMPNLDEEGKATASELALSMVRSKQDVAQNAFDDASSEAPEPLSLLKTHMHEAVKEVTLLADKLAATQVASSNQARAYSAPSNLGVGVQDRTGGLDMNQDAQGLLAQARKLRAGK